MTRPNRDLINCKDFPDFKNPAGVTMPIFSACNAELENRFHQRMKNLPDRRLVMFIMMIGGIFGFMCYWQLLDQYGTFAPWFALYYTKDADRLHDSEPPADFTRKSFPHRVVLSLTTMPENIENLPLTLRSLINQNFAVDAIYVNVPKVNARTGVAYPEPTWEKSLPAVTVNRLARDYGPLTKLMGSLFVEKDPKTVVITVDDDKVYDPNLVRKLVWYSHNDPTKAFGPCGFSFLPMPRPRGVVPVYIPWFLRGKGRYIDELQAVCGILYRVGFFAKDVGLKHLEKPPMQCFTTDDLWIAGNLAVMHDVPRVLIGMDKSSWIPFMDRSLDPKNPKWKQVQTDGHSLSSENSKAGKDIGCVEAVEAHFGKRWPRIADL